MSEVLAEGRVDSWAFRRVGQSQFFVLSIGDAKSLYDLLRTETSGGANDRRTVIDIQIIRATTVA